MPWPGVEWIARGGLRRAGSNGDVSGGGRALVETVFATYTTYAFSAFRDPYFNFVSRFSLVEQGPTLCSPPLQPLYGVLRRFAGVCLRIFFRRL